MGDLMTDGRVEQWWLFTARLALRPWSEADAPGALEIYGDPQVARWLSPVLRPVADEPAMRRLLRAWRPAGPALEPVGHWAVVRAADGVLLGGLAIRDLATVDGDLEIAWQLARHAWGQGYAAEAGHALTVWALEHSGVDELFALVRPANTRGHATARRIGMEWVGETEKYHRLRLQVYRARLADLVRPTVVEGVAARALARLEQAS